jgi:hypothetical protein
MISGSQHNYPVVIGFPSCYECVYTCDTVNDEHSWLLNFSLTIRCYIIKIYSLKFSIILDHFCNFL